MEAYDANDYVTFHAPHAERFGVIMAGGDGVRLRQMTKRIAGCEMPKQFCPILGDESLLSNTIKRIEQKLESTNIFYNLTESHREYFEPILGSISRKNRIIQPANKGTAVAILYSLFRLAKVNRHASVAFFPADHYISDDEAFMNHVDKAFAAVSDKTDAVVLLGVEPNAPKSFYGWIEPNGGADGESLQDIQEVRRFWEKPNSRQAADLMAKGCLWNSFVMVGKIRNLQGLFRKYLPELYTLFCLVNMTIGTSAEKMAMKAIYRMIGNRDFSREILEKCVDELYVLRTKGFSWSDLGEPEEVLSRMAELGLKNKLFPLAV